MTIDLNTLWDFAKPELSEQRFTSALEGASAEDTVILKTQIARTFGLRRDFLKAREILRSIVDAQQNSSPEARVRYLLELGRTFASTAHTKDAQTPDDLEKAGDLFLRAHNIAASANLDSLAIDALHMMPCVDSEPDRQLEWNERALAYMERSVQAEAKKWEASLRNNVGYAKHLKGEYDAALEQFQLSRAAHERANRIRNVRIADWMIAWTFRAQKKYAEALAIQLELERDWDADGDPDPYVYEELEHLYRAFGNEEMARHYCAKLKATQ
jgi:tetratricopeptide (TPR) repeat protein